MKRLSPVTLNLITRRLTEDRVLRRDMLDRVRTEIPSYSSPPENSLLASIDRTIALAVRVLENGVVPSADEIWEAEISAGDRLDQGLQVEDLMSGFRVVMAELQSRLVAMAAQEIMSGDSALLLSSLLWRLGDSYSARIAMVAQQKNIDDEVAILQRRTQWLERILNGSLSDDQVTTGMALYGVPSGRLLRGFVSEHLISTDARKLESQLRRHVDRFDGLILAGLSNGRLIGLVEGLPESFNHWIAVGPPRPLDRIQASYQVAQKILHAALTSRAGSGTTRSKVLTLERLTWRATVPLHPELTSILHARYLGEVLNQGEFTEPLLEALHAYLRSGRNARQAASHIPVHVNTLRYRLSRFEEISGANLRDTETIIGLSWALYAYELGLESPDHSP